MVTTIAMEQNTLLWQLCQLIGMNWFLEAAEKAGMNRYCKTLNAEKVFKSLMIVQVARLDSLRALEQYTEDNKEALAAEGIPRIARSTLAEALARMDANVFEDFFRILADALTAKVKNRKAWWQNPLSLIDSTSFHVGLKRVPWARCAKSDGAIKMHTVLGRAGGISFPRRAVITAGNIADVYMAEKFLLPEPDSISVMDRGYSSKAFFQALERLHRAFVCRTKNATRYYYVGDIPTEKSEGALRDEIVVLRIEDIHNPKALRFRRTVLPPFSGHARPLVVITNLFDRTASEIGEIYHARWQIEIFFKWIKTHTKIKTFLGTTENAIRIQLYVALIVSLLVAYLHTLTSKLLEPRIIFRRLSNRLLHRISGIEALFLEELPRNAHAPPLIKAEQLCFDI